MELSFQPFLDAKSDVMKSITHNSSEAPLSADVAPNTTLDVVETVEPIAPYITQSIPQKNLDLGLSRANSATQPGRAGWFPQPRLSWVNFAVFSQAYFCMEITIRWLACAVCSQALGTLGGIMNRRS